MDSAIINRIDTIIEKYKKEHKGEASLYIILSPDENKEVIGLIKAANNFGEDRIITDYKGIKLAQHPSQINGKIYVSNELPETGS